jgi:hypothetical protein
LKRIALLSARPSWRASKPRGAPSFCRFNHFEFLKEDLMKRIVQISALVLAALAGCHAQVPPASNGYKVVLSGTVPAPTGNWAGCTTSAPCTYAFYAETITSGTCDPTTSANYKEISNPASRPTTPNFTDANTTGLTRCYDAETVQGAENSGPSNIAGPVVSPGVPLAPALATPAPEAAQLEKPSLPNAAPASQFAKKLPAPSLQVAFVPAERNTQR